MAKALEREAETQKYFRDNWTDTEIQIPDVSFDNDSLDTWISLRYDNSDNKLAGLQRQHGFGTLNVYCYHKVRKLSQGLSDDVKEFFDCKDLPKDIHVGIGYQHPTAQLENKTYFTLVQFEVSQYS